MKSMFAPIAVLLSLTLGMLLVSTQAHAQITSGCVYTLVCKTSGLALDNGGSKSPSSTLSQRTLAAGNANQEWRITSLGNGKYVLVNLASSMAMDNGGTKNNGAGTEQWFTTTPGNINQQWSITNVANGYFQLTCASSGFALDNGGSTSNGAGVIQYTSNSNSSNQQWAIVPASGFVYNLIAKPNGLAIDNGNTANAGNNVVQWGLGAGSTNQQWTLNLQGSGKYSLVNLTSGMALDNGNTATNGAQIMQNYASSGSSNQQWAITNMGNGYYMLVNAMSGLAIDDDNVTSNGGPVVQWTATYGNQNQEWALVPVQIGASVPFTEYEAEAGMLGGGAAAVSLTGPSTTEFSSPQLEASGHAYVNLGGTGQSVTWTNNTGQNITAINMRYSIPDAPSGGGITSTIDLYVNGVFRQAISVNSIQTWLYESASSYDGQNQSPSAGTPHEFWDETHLFISGAPIAPGSTIGIQKDSSNTASFYNIDLIDFEAPAAPLTQPANSLSITSYGALANSKYVDSSAAIQNCINDAEAQGKSVWIPQGTFYLNRENSLQASGVTIQGAGMWYSTVYYSPPLPTSSIQSVFVPVSCTLQNFAIDGEGMSQQTTDADAYALNVKGSNWTINGMWISHEGPGIWADGTNGIVENCRVNNTWADGINLNNGNGTSGNNAGNNLTVKNNFVRGSGDDGIALNNGPTPCLEMNNTTIINNTVVAPWWANIIGVYGGVNDLVANNLCTDSAKLCGIGVTLFANWAYMDSARIAGNTILRGGSLGYGAQLAALAVGGGSNNTATTITNVTVCGNTVVNSMFDGLDVTSGSGMSFNGNTISAPNLTGIHIDSAAHGSASFTSNTVLNIKPGQSAYVDSAPTGNFSVAGSGNIGFSAP